MQRVMSATVCRPLVDVIHSGDGVLCLCRLQVSNSSLSAMFITCPPLGINLSRGVVFLSVARGAPNTFSRKKDGLHAKITTSTHTCNVWLQREAWIPGAKPLSNELLIDSAEMSSVALISLFYSTVPN